MSLMQSERSSMLFLLYLSLFFFSSSAYQLSLFFKSDIFAKKWSKTQSNCKPWFWGIGIDDAATTAAWTDEEAEAFAIQPAKAPALAAAPVAGKGYTPKRWNEFFSDQHLKIKSLFWVRKINNLRYHTPWAPRDV